MKKAKAKEIIGKLLMAFVLVSIGFAAGKEITRRSMLAQSGNTESGTLVETQAESGNRKSSRLIVYYMHATFRCFTCNSIETMAKEVLEQDFPDELAAGRIEWKTVNFQESPQLARRYGVGTSTLVIVKLEDGREVDFNRLDGVWTHVGNPAAFKAYIDENIQAYLDGGA